MAAWPLSAAKSRCHLPGERARTPGPWLDADKARWPRSNIAGSFALPQSLEIRFIVNALLFLPALSSCPMAASEPSLRTARETARASSLVYAQSHSLPPRPTSAPKYDLARRGLQARLLENVCGWNEENIPRTCGANLYCAFIPNYWGCCGVDSDGAFYSDCEIGTTCLDNAAYTASCEPNDCGFGTVWW